ncbi:MAG: hypothetical protein HYW48_09685 [Deltaproteobacteria bacterium]|nr:hypothetical protein [Deltaproteobacteria bacterium]
MMKFILSFLFLAQSVTGLSFVDVMSCKTKTDGRKYDLKVYSKPDPVLGLNLPSFTQYHVTLSYKERDILDRLADELMDRDHILLNTMGKGLSTFGDFLGGFTIQQGNKTYKFRFKNRKKTALVTIQTAGREDREELAFNDCVTTIEEEP